MSDQSGPGVSQDPKIYDVAELPPAEKGRPCPIYVGKDRAPCGNPSEYVFVYKANLDPGDDRRKNCLCCVDCKPAPITPPGGSGSS